MDMTQRDFILQEVDNRMTELLRKDRDLADQRALRLENAVADLCDLRREVDVAMGLLFSGDDGAHYPSIKGAPVIKTTDEAQDHPPIVWKDRTYKIGDGPEFAEGAAERLLEQRGLTASGRWAKPKKAEPSWTPPEPPHQWIEALPASFVRAVGKGREIIAEAYAKAGYETSIGVTDVAAGHIDREMAVNTAWSKACQTKPELYALTHWPPYHFVLNGGHGVCVVFDLPAGPTISAPKEALPERKPNQSDPRATSGGLTPVRPHA